MAGHRFIADRIFEALPDARFPYKDISYGAAEYKAVEYMYLNGLMTGKDDESFGGEEKMTKAELSAVLNKIADYEETDSTSEVNGFSLNTALYKASDSKGIFEFFSYVYESLELILTGKGFKAVTRAEAAFEIYNALIK